MKDTKTDYVALTIISLILSFNLCCCNIISSILGLTSLVYLIKCNNSNDNTKIENYNKKVKILIVIGYGITILELVIGYIVNFTDILIKIGEFI